MSRVFRRLSRDNNICNYRVINDTTTLGIVAKIPIIMLRKTNFELIRRENAIFFHTSR